MLFHLTGSLEMGGPGWCSGSVMLWGTLAPSVFLLPTSSVRRHSPTHFLVPGWSRPGCRLVASWLQAVTSWLRAGRFLVVGWSLPGSGLVTSWLWDGHFLVTGCHFLVTGWLLPGYKQSLPGYGLGGPAPISQVKCRKRKKEASVEKEVEAFPEIPGQHSSHIMAD